MSGKGMSVEKVSEAMRVVVDEVEKYLMNYGDADGAVRNVEGTGLVDAYNACWDWLNQDGGALNLLDRLKAQKISEGAS